MKITNINVYGLNESIAAIKLSYADMYVGDQELKEKDINIAKKLGKTKSGSGHDCFLKGIIVQMDVSGPHYWWPQFQRYHFADFVMSMSKMHAITKFDLESQCNKYVSHNAIKVAKYFINAYNACKVCNINEHNKRFHQMMANLPMGLELTARISTNYMQLKTIYHQRKNHKLEDWKVFCEIIETLPMFKELILGD